MGVGRITAIVLGTAAVVLALLLLQQPVSYELVQDCPPNDSICFRESRSALACSAPLFGDPEPRTHSTEVRSRCERGRVWRWGIYGGAGATGMVAVLVSTAGVPLARRVRRSAVSA